MWLVAWVFGAVAIGAARLLCCDAEGVGHVCHRAMACSDLGRGRDASIAPDGLPP
jgi:hypothetical protein